MRDMPRTTGKERNRTRLPNKETAKDGLKIVGEFLPSAGRKLRIPLGQIQEDVTVMCCLRYEDCRGVQTK